LHVKVELASGATSKEKKLFVKGLEKNRVKEILDNIY
jgi:uncharacterized protein YggU (UPF0235/DUF167 family)